MDYYYGRLGYRIHLKNTREDDHVPISCRILSDYFSPGNKVKDLIFHRQAQSHNFSFTLETPMKPSQVPNRFPHPPPRRSLPFQSPEQYHRHRQHFSMTPCHPPQPPGPNHYLGFGRVSPMNAENFMSPQRHCPPQPFNSHGPAQISPGAPLQLQQHTPVNNFHNPCAIFTPDISSQATFSHFRRDPRLKSADTLPSPESRDPPRHDLNKVESSPVGSVPMIQLHKPAHLPPLGGSVNERVPLQRSDSWSPCSSSSTNLGLSPICDQGRRTSYPPTSTQIQHHEWTPSNEKSHAEDVNHSIQKRCRESGSDDDSAKKQCLQAVGSDRKLKCNAGNEFNPPSSSSSSSQKPLSDSELSPKTSENHSRTESTPENSVKPAQSTALTPKPCLNQNAMGAKQACIKSMHNNLVILSSPLKKSEILTKVHEEANKKDNIPSSSTSPTHKNTASFNGHTTPNAPKCPNKVSQVGENKMVDLNSHKPALKPSSSSAGSTSCRKLHRVKKPVIADDINDLFTPDPMTYIVNSGHKTLKGRPDEKAKANISDKSGPSSISSNPQTPAAKPCQKEKTPISTFSSSQASCTNPTNAILSGNVQISLPTVALTRVRIDNLPASCKSIGTKSVSMASSDKHHEKHKPQSPRNATSCAVDKDAAAAAAAPPSPPPPRRPSPPPPQSLSPPRMDKQSEAREKMLGHEDSLDLDLELNFDFDMDAESSHSSEDEQLLSLQEIMTRKTKPPETPEKVAFSEPSTPGHTNHKRNQHLASTAKAGNYKNNLDQMLKEINTSKKAKEIETELLTACQEDLLRLAEYEEEAEENREEPISAEQQRFLQRYSLMSSAIREVPPGHLVFHLEKFGRIFDQNTLQLRQCMLSPQETAQKTLLWSSHAQLKLYINIGLFQEAYDSRSPCPCQVTRFLFKMMSVHSERILSEKILQVLCDIAYTAASQKVKKGNQRFKVWVPTLADITLVLMNMGVPFVSLFPLESLQPPFTEGDLLEDVYIKSENPSSQKPSTFPEHNCNNIFKYLSCCAGLCPRSYTDSELLLLLTLLTTIGLDSRLILQTSVELYPLLYQVLNNIRDWDNMMPKICLALTDLTDDHHNMCHLVQLLPDHSRGKQLRRHLCLSMISKLLDGSCLYRPKNKELQLCDLRLYLSRMKPSSLLQTLLGSSHRSHIEGEEEDLACLDQQAYYLCYSLLTLANEASNFQFFPAHQKEQLLFLCSELERHVKCHIRESEKCLYRSKVKDLVARIYTKWQMLLQRTRPLNGKLYDYWQPPQGDAASSQDIEEVESNPGDTEKDSVSEEEAEVEEAGSAEEAGSKMEDEEKEELTEEALTQNGPQEDADDTTEETNAAKEEEVDQELNEEKTEEARSQDERMDCEDGELYQLVPNVAKECVEEEEKVNSTLVEETVEGNDRDLTRDMDTDSSTDETNRENTSTEPMTTESQGSGTSEQRGKQTQAENMKFVKTDSDTEDIALSHWVHTH